MRSLYFICPTDYLESIIRNTFKGESYFYSSLGNCITFDDSYHLGQIKYLIRSHSINNICFVLSHDNRILTDAIHRQQFPEIRALYSQILGKENNREGPNSKYHQFLSRHLSAQVEELKLRLSKTIPWELTIKGKIYYRELNQFHNLYTNLIYDVLPSLN